MASESWTSLRALLQEPNPTANLWWKCVELVISAEEEEELLVGYLLSHVRSDQAWSACAVPCGRWEEGHPGWEWSEVQSRPIPALKGAKEVFCPPGTYTLGASEDEWEASGYEKPQLDFTLTRGFWALSTPVTQTMYETVMGMNPSSLVKKKSPVEMVAWLDTISFCNRLSVMAGLEEAYDCPGYEEWVKKGRRAYDNNDDKVPKVTWNREANGFRLPTNVEWESMCRAGCLKSRYDHLSLITNTKMRKLFSVASRKPNAWGLYDTLGNVWEWVYDDFNGRREEWPTTDPVFEGTEQWPLMTLRGGAWNAGDSLQTAHTIGAGRASQRLEAWGFRFVRTAMPGGV